mgnify:CR=1 FL=1
MSNARFGNAAGLAASFAAPPSSSMSTSTPSSRGHAPMIATVKAVPPAQFDQWLAYQKTLISEANEQAKVARAKLNSQTGAGQVENP